MQGYRTHIIGGLMAVASVLFGMGFLDRDAYLTILGVLNGGGFMAMRAGIAHEAQAAPAAVTRAVEASVPQAVAAVIREERR